MRLDYYSVSADTPIPLCLAGLELCETVDQQSIILIQYGGRRIDFGKSDLRFQYIQLPEEGTFSLAKLRNVAVKSAATEWVTILNPWVVVPPDFLSFANDLAFAPQHSLIYFPIRHLDSDASGQINSRFNSFYQTVLPSAANWRLRCETYKGRTVGTECFTVRKADYLHIGGYDELYGGSYLAHLDFACRWLNAFGQPHRATCSVYHRWRRVEFGRDDPSHAALAREYFAVREATGFPLWEEAPIGGADLHAGAESLHTEAVVSFCLQSGR